MNPVALGDAMGAVYDVMVVGGTVGGIACAVRCAARRR